MSSPLALRDYQSASLEAVPAAAQRGVRRQMLVMPPGAGKTVVFSELARRVVANPGIIQAPGKRIAILAHRDELVSQAVAKLHAQAPDLSVGVVQGPRNEIDADVIVASVPTLATARRRAQLPDDFGLIVVDECHHAAARTWRAALTHFRAGEANGPLLLGVSATPDRADGKGLDDLFDQVVFEVNLLELMEAGYLSPLRARRITYAADFRQLRVVAGEISAASAETAFMDGGGPQAVAKTIRQEAADRQHILVFVPGIASADATAELLCRQGVTAAAVNGEMSLDDRRDTIARFRNGDLRVLVNCMLLTEGTDLPMVDAVVLARPTTSRALFVQMAGRGFRTYEGKQDCLLLDLTGNSTKHALVTPAALVGLNPRDVEPGEDLREAVERKRRKREAFTLVDRDIQIRSRSIEIFRDRPVAWTAAAEDRYSLSLGDSQLLVRPDRETAGAWVLLEHSQQGTRSLADGLSLEYAISMAEEHAAQRGASALLNPKAAWRADPATPGQLRYMQRLGIRLPRKPMTKGEASALIDAAKAKRVA